MGRGPEDFSSQPQTNERVKSPAVEYRDERFLARSHKEAWALAGTKYPEVKAFDIPTKVQYEGAVTTSDRFVKRNEAFQIAKRNNQLKKSPHSDIGLFVSEDLIY